LWRINGLQAMFNPRESFFLQWHITDRCNLACRHCYRDAAKADLDFVQLINVFKNFQRLRDAMPQEKARVQIAGGEPYLSEHLFPVLDMIAAAGFQSRILTNGTLIDAKAAKETKAHGCHIVQISVDGSNPSGLTLFETQDLLVLGFCVSRRIRAGALPTNMTGVMFVDWAVALTILGII